MILSTSQALDARIASWSNYTKLPPETLIFKAIELYLDDWEDFQDALRICDDVDSGRMNVYSLDEVERQLDELNHVES